MAWVVADGRNLRGDLHAPVSRASVARLGEAGWLALEAAGEKYGRTRRDATSRTLNGQARGGASSARPSL